ncbi:uncharacterized protein LOC100501237 [Zea mays]|uniref:WRC domain-containing protein n=1 Tax=Zea mays TaxID=4577 RepID=C0HIB5_MAIZE|eukprot:NP_001338885.1 uncharacterized protein LOC100501237 [Zea mays]
MRIRKSASRLLGSAYSASAASPVDSTPPFSPLPPPPPPPPPHLAPCSAPEYCGGLGFSSPSSSSAEPCELSRSPWDLIAELSVSDPQVEDDIVDKYFVHVATRSSWLFSATVPAASAKKKSSSTSGDSKHKQQLRRDAVNKSATSKEKVGEANKKAKVKKEEEGQDGDRGARVWLCKKNDGKRWHCNRPVSQPNTLCEYHSVQKRSYLEAPSVAKLEEAPAPAPAAAPKSSARNKPRKKKPGSDVSATEGFYYYAGFGPFRSTKRQCKSGGTNEPAPAKEDDEGNQAKHASPGQKAEVDEGHHDDTTTNQTATAAYGDTSSCEDDIAGTIAGVDEGSSDDDDFDGLGISGHSMNGNGDPKASSGDVKTKIPWKRWRKPVKARSLKSLM